MRPKRATFIPPLAMVVTLGVSSTLILSETAWRIVQAQDAATTVRIENLTRMAPINQVLKQQYEAQTPEASIEIKTQPTDAPLQLQGQQADLAAISRLLTDEEKAQGLVQVPVTREKIAIVIGKDNPFAQGLTIDQVVKIFRGDITNWSELGGPSAPIRVVHRPIASNLQSTLKTYDLFQTANFEAGGQIVQLDQNDISVLVESLGEDGISYALASQIGEAASIRPVPMYKTLPDDPRYPFSQPFTYVYQDQPTASAQTFLDFVASAPGQAAIAEAKTQPTVSDDLEVNSASTSDATKNADGNTKTHSELADNASSDQSSDQPSSVSSTGSSGSSSDGTDPGSSTVASSATDTAGEAQDGSGGLGWLPITLMVLVLGGLVGGVFKTLLTKSKPKPAPRPAPNYAEKIRPTRIQATATTLQGTSDASGSMPTDSISTDSMSIDEGGEPPLSSEDVIAGAAVGAVSEGAAAPESELQVPEAEPQVPEIEPQSPNEWVDITSKELTAQTRIQNPKTELQDTPPSQRDSKTQIQDPTTTQLQVSEYDDFAAAGVEQNLDSNPTQVVPIESSPTQLHDSSSTQLQDSSPTQLQEPNLAHLQDSSPTQLQEPNLTQLQDSSPTHLQGSSPTRLQEMNPTQLQDSSPTQLQDFSPTQLQETNPTQLQDSSPTQLQDSMPSQVQEPLQAWTSEVDNPFDLDSRATVSQEPDLSQHQDPRQTWIQDEELSSPGALDTSPLPDPKQTWIQSEEFPEGMEPQVPPSPDPKQTWIQDEEEG